MPVGGRNFSPPVEDGRVTPKLHAAMQALQIGGTLRTSLACIALAFGWSARGGGGGTGNGLSCASIKTCPITFCFSLCTFTTCWIEMVSGDSSSRTAMKGGMAAWLWWVGNFAVLSEVYEG